MTGFTIEVQVAPAYELILSLGVLSDVEGRSLYEIGPGWFEAAQAAVGPDLLAAIEGFSGGSDKVWAHVLSLAYEMPPPREVPAFLESLETADAMEIRRRLLGFYTRHFRRATPPATIAAAAAGELEAQRQFLATSYPSDSPWQAALQALLPLDAQTTKARLLAILRDWHTRVFSAQEARLLPVLQRDVEARTALARTVPPERLIEIATNGWDFVPEPGIRHVLLIPSVLLRPVLHSFDHHDVHVICCPVADESLAAADDAPSPRLLRLLKALADERRLRILKRLTMGTYSLAELADHFGVGSTTLLHHMVVLRGAGLVRLHGGSKRYTLRRGAFPDVADLLDRYLDGEEKGDAV
jgi:DNA-binding transcriptional ArsR family regulator